MANPHPSHALSSFTIPTHIVQILPCKNFTLRPLVPLQHRHPHPLQAQLLTLILRLFLPPQHDPLEPQTVHDPLFPVEPDDVPPRQAKLPPCIFPQVPLVRLVAQLVVYDVVHRILREPVLPRPAHLARRHQLMPRGAPGCADARNEVLGGGGDAELVQDEGHVLVEVVVFKLQVVGFGGRGAGCRVLAEAVGVDEVVAGVGGVVACEAFDAALFDLGAGDGVSWGGEE